MASSSCDSKFRKNSGANAPEFGTLPTVHVVGDSSKEGKQKKKKAFWKKVFRKKKNGDKKNGSTDAEVQQMEMERQNLLPADKIKVKAVTEITVTSNIDGTDNSPVAIHKTYHSVSNVAPPEQVTPEPTFKKNRQTGPLQIAWPDSNKSGLTINVKPMCRLLAQPEIANLPVAIFSINGTTRGGKSFLLNQAVKFLKFGKSHPNDWIDQEMEVSFDWSFRMESVTEGIQVWPEPFILEDGNGEKLVLILVDNQGLEDIHTTTHVAYKLFCLSNLLSSVFTYCDTQAYTKNYLESLHTFMEFSKSVEHDGRSTVERNENLNYTFGKLILLFRDFRFVKDFPCDDGCSFFDKNISNQKNNKNNLYARIFNGDEDNVSKVVRDKRSALLEFYDDIIISTMIGPGNREPNNTERLHSSTWDPDYKKGIMKFIENVFSYKFMSQSIKKISGHVVTAETLIRYVKNWAKIISEKNYNISDITGLEASRNLYYNQKIEESLHFYMTTMDRYKISPEGSDICQVLVDTIKLIETRFWTDCEYGDWRGFYMEKMQMKISDYSNEQSVYLHFIISEKRKRKENGAVLSGVIGGVILAGGTIAIAIKGGGLVAILLTVSGGAVVLGAVAVLAYWLWKDMRERNAVRKISSKVDSQFGIKSDFNFKEQLRLMKRNRQDANTPRVLMIFKSCC